MTVILEYLNLSGFVYDIIGGTTAVEGSTPLAPFHHHYTCVVLYACNGWLCRSITDHYHSCHCSSDAQAAPKGPYIKMFSPEQVTALAYMFKEVIDNYSDQNGASEYLGN